MTESKHFTSDNIPLEPEVSLNPQLGGYTSTIQESKSEFEVFISYRTNPDQQLAIALRTLLEGAIDPSPKVFVAGAGGLRPSNIGYKPQIQAAAQSSRAFIAIITHQSKDREWLFYEAGAAWGRNQLFTPLLIGTSPGELASTMADYQTVRASIPAEVENLIRVIAEVVGGKVKTHFSRRYKTFSAQIEGYQGIEKIEETKAEPSPLDQAISLLQLGEIEKANTLFAQLKDAALDKEAEVKIEIARLINEPQTEGNTLTKLESLLPNFQDTCQLQYWLGLFENRTALSISYYERCLELAEGNNEVVIFANLAIIQLVYEKFQLGEEEVALEICQKIMISKNRDLRQGAVNAWMRIDQAPHSLEQLVILSAGLNDKPDSLAILTKLTNLAIDNNWYALIAYFSQRADKEDAQGYAANNLGRAFSELKLYSLAYLAYTKAAETGISVAKVNMVQLLSNYPIPSAGLKLLQEHVGDYDAADVGYPYLMRSSIERAIQTEREEADEKYKEGSKLAKLISYFAWEAIHSVKVAPKIKQVELKDGLANLEIVSENELKLTSQDGEVYLKLKRISCAIGLWEAVDRGSTVILCCFMEAGYMLQLTVQLTGPSSGPFLKKCPTISIPEAIVRSL